MKTLNNYILILSVSLFIILAGCKKENTLTTPDPLDQSAAMLKNYQQAASNDVLLVNYHQHAGTGNHDSCFYYWNQFYHYDSLFSYEFYGYCRTIYANNGGQNYGNDGWNWNYDNGGMMNQGNWQCGLDTLQYQNWNGYGDCRGHDSQMYSQMQNYGMMGYFSSQATQSYTNMQALRDDHFNNHNYHW